jgi:hypothetical protein
MSSSALELRRSDPRVTRCAMPRVIHEPQSQEFALSPPSCVENSSAILDERSAACGNDPPSPNRQPFQKITELASNPLLVHFATANWAVGASERPPRRIHQPLAAPITGVEILRRNEWARQKGVRHEPAPREARTGSPATSCPHVLSRTYVTGRPRPFPTARLSPRIASLITETSRSSQSASSSGPENANQFPMDHCPGAGLDARFAIGRASEARPIATRRVPNKLLLDAPRCSRSRTTH